MMAEDLADLIERRWDELRGRKLTPFEKWRRDFGWRISGWANRFCPECALFMLAAALYMIAAGLQVFVRLVEMGWL